MAEDRRKALRELELEFRYLSTVQQEARMARVPWIEKLAGELKVNLRAFWDRIEAGEE